MVIPQSCTGIEVFADMVELCILLKLLRGSEAFWNLHDEIKYIT